MRKDIGKMKKDTWPKSGELTDGGKKKGETRRLRDDTYKRLLAKIL
jgi:hypothetical protein